MIRSLTVDGVHYINDGIRKERAGWSEIGLKPVSGPHTHLVVRNASLPTHWLHHGRPGSKVRTGGHDYKAICCAR